MTLLTISDFGRRVAEGDLRVTTGYRQVLGEVVHKRFPAEDVHGVPRRLLHP